MSLKAKQDSFLKTVQVNAIDEACGNALRASLQRSGTYADNSSDRYMFQQSFRQFLRDELEAYRQGIHEDTHLERIQFFVSKISDEYSDILKNGRFRIGIAQKALNLYLKIAWCIEPDFAIPPHCPIDRGVLRYAGIHDNWTQLDSIEVYQDWIRVLRRRALESGSDSLSAWELGIWIPG